MLLQIQFEGLGSSQSRLIGMDCGNFIIIRTPPLMGIKTKLFEKNHGIIRYLFSGHVYAFHCTLLSVIAEPYRLSILSYPESFENMNLRKHERIPCIIASEVNFDGWINKGIVSNISMGGCSFEFNRSGQHGFPDLKIFDEVALSLFLHDQGAATVFKAAVRKVQIDQESMMIGLQFANSETTESGTQPENALKEYLLTLQQS
ncbi:MAG: flagellar brake protein [Deltaproteobacteria bacterium]|nr:flagellar brake protein [Deltaproteobacteria bacterium]